MKNLYRLLALISFAGSAFAAGPFLTIGDNTTVALTLFAGVRYDTNIGLTEANRQDDFIFQFTPGVVVNYGVDGAPTRAKFSFSETFNRYDDYSQYNADLANFQFSASHNTLVLKNSLNASFVQYSVNSGDPTSGIPSDQLKEKRDYLSVGYNAEYTLSPKTRIGLGITYQKTNYTNRDYSDVSSYTVPLTFYYQYSQKLDLTLGAQYRFSDPSRVLNGADRGNYNDIYYSFGFRGEITPKLTGTANVGVTTRFASKDDDKVIFGCSAGLNYFYSPKTQFYLNARNDFGNRAYDGGNQKTFFTALGMQTDLALQWRWNAQFGYTRTDYMDGYAALGGRVDDYYEFSTSILYLFNENTSLSLGYIYRDNSSSARGCNFIGNVFALSFSTKY